VCYKKKGHTEKVNYSLFGLAKNRFIGIYKVMAHAYARLIA